MKEGGGGFGDLAGLDGDDDDGVSSGRGSREGEVDRGGSWEGWVGVVFSRLEGRGSGLDLGGRRRPILIIVCDD